MFKVRINVTEGKLNMSLERSSNPIHCDVEHSAQLMHKSNSSFIDDN